jgi:hypothetical protein
VDYDEPWYDDTDEETFRPWLEAVPVDPAFAIFLVAATFTFADGSTHPGFVTPATDPHDMGTLQPSVFVGDGWYGFWGGMPGVPRETRAAFYQAVGEAPERVFPAAFSGAGGFATGVVKGTVEGFYRHAENGIECIR